MLRAALATGQYALWGLPDRFSRQTLLPGTPRIVAVWGMRVEQVSVALTLH